VHRPLEQQQQCGGAYVASAATWAAAHRGIGPEAEASAATPAAALTSAGAELAASAAVVVVVIMVMLVGSWIHG
jgi:hypothetical protein